MSDTIYKNSQSFDTSIKFGNIIADTSNMANHRNNEPHIWDRYNTSMGSFYRRFISSTISNYTTLHKNNMYSIPIFAKASIILAAWWEAFMVHNIVVQWVVSIFVLLGSSIWLMSYWLTYKKKKFDFEQYKKRRSKEISEDSESKTGTD